MMRKRAPLHWNKKTRTTAMVILALILITWIISFNTGQIRIAPTEAILTLLGQGSPEQELILFEFRLPRMVVAFLVGMALAVSGAVLQGIVHNPLADPGMIGINAGAGLAVMLYLAFFSTELAISPFVLPIFSFLGAAGAALIIFLLSYQRNEGIRPVPFLLTGIAVAAGVNALMIVFTLKFNEDQYQFLATWLAGGIWGTDWKFVYALIPWLLILLPFVYWKASVLNVLQVGQETGISLGLDLKKERRKLLFAAVGLAAASVSISGGIGFIGLIAPHVTRRLVGYRHQAVIPISALVGALLLLASDTIGRWIIQPSEIPAGLIVSMIGAPYFLYLLATIDD